MNFKFKALVAALALVAVSAPAQSAVRTPTVSGDSSMILTLLDKSASISATFDLGPVMTSFNGLATGATNTVFTVNTGLYATAWNTFWASASDANVKWAVFGGDNFGAGSVGAKRFTSSYLSGSTVQTTANQATTLANMHNFVSAQNSLGTHLSSGANGDGASTSTSGTAYAGVTAVYGGSDQLSNTSQTFKAAAGINQTMKVFASSSGATNGAITTVTFLGNINGQSNLVFNKQAGTLTLAVAVPEADTSAMLIAGLGLMGAFARRRAV